MKGDYQMMLRHLQLLFAGCSDGMAELAFGCPAPNKALLSRVDELDRLAGEGLLQNGRGYNIYVGACVRHADTAPFARSHDRDVIYATAVVVDLDLPSRAENAPQLWEDTPPSFCVVTGLHPHKRMQMWWLLSEPLTDLALWSQLQRAMAAKYDGDRTVHNPSRVMRLAGSIAQPVKEGRVQEPTFLESVRDPLPRYSTQQLAAHCDQFLDAGLARNDVPQTVGATVSAQLGTNSLGIGNGKLIDGREQYMRDTVLACLRAFIGTHGAEPTPQELYALVWPQYEQHVVIDVPGKRYRGEAEVLQKCHVTLERFHRGDISSMRDLDAAVASHEQRNPTARPGETPTSTETVLPETPVSPPPQPAPPPQQQRAVCVLSMTRFIMCDPNTIASRDWLYGHDYIRNYTSCTIAPGAAGKSSLLTVEALAMTTGKPLLGIAPKRPLRVWMWNGEDPYEELERRIIGAALAYGLTPDDVGGRLFVNSGRDSPLKLVNSINRTTLVDTSLAATLIRQAQHHQIDVMILDPLVSIHSMSENDNVAMDMLIKQLDVISQQAHVAIMLAHHSRKTNGSDITTEDARGASSLLAAVRSGRVINTMSKEEAAQLGVKNRRLHFRLENGKLNMAPPPADAADWFELRGQPLGNGPLGMGGDSVGVVFKWNRPDVMDGFTGRDVDRALSELRSGRWRADTQSTAWAGHAVAQALGLDINDGASKARVKAMLRRWEQNGALRRVRKIDPANRHERTFFEVNDGDDYVS